MVNWSSCLILDSHSSEYIVGTEHSQLCLILVLYSQVPRDLADAIYGRVQGASYDTKNEWWTVPCGQLLNVTINFGGKSYPVHPLDTVDDAYGLPSVNGTNMCVGTVSVTTKRICFGRGGGGSCFP